MVSLSYRQQKIQEKRKQTPWREFVREICSRMPLAFYKHHGWVTRYPDTKRVRQVVHAKTYEELRDGFSSIVMDTLGEKGFWQTFSALYAQIPVPHMVVFGESENAEFADNTYFAKNVYLSNTVTMQSSNVAYSLSVKNNNDNIFDSMMIWNHNSHIYTSRNVLNSYEVFYSQYIEGSSDIRFSRGLTGCTSCLFCQNLEQRSYCIHNQQLSPEEFVQEKQTLLAKKALFPGWYASILSDDGATHPRECEDVQNTFFAHRVTHGRNLVLVGGYERCEHLYDSMATGGSTEGIPSTNHSYATIIGGAIDHAYCQVSCAFGMHIYYCIDCQHCSYCLGCIGLKNKSYCMFNKQYSKEDRYEKVDEIFAQMEQEGTLGQFFPGWMNPFYFNDTAAYLIDPTFTKEEVTAMGYLWRDEPIKVDIPTGVQTVAVEDLGNYEGWILNGAFSPLTHFDVETFQRGNVEAKRYIDPAILKKVIIDEHGNAYRIVKMEYDFLMKHGLPLPRKHWLERMKENFQME